MRYAILTQYLKPTEILGSAILAQSCGGTITVPYDHELNLELNHRAAAMMLATNLGWEFRLVGGELPGAAYCFVQVKNEKV